MSCAIFLLLLANLVLFSVSCQDVGAQTLPQRLRQTYNKPMPQDNKQFIDFKTGLSIGAVALSAKYFSTLSDKTELLDKTIAHFISEVETQKLPSAMISVAMRLKSVVAASGTHFLRRSVEFGARYAYLVAASASTLKTLYDVYSFESVLEHSGIQIEEVQQTLRSEVRPRLDLMMQALLTMSDHVHDHVYNSTFPEHHSYFEHLSIVFERNHQQVSHFLLEMRAHIERMSSALLVEQDYYARKRSSSLKTAGVTLLYLGLSVVAPPVAAALGASASIASAVSAIVVGVNSGLAYYSHSKIEKAAFRQKELDGLRLEIENVKTELNLFHEQFLLVKKEYDETRRTLREMPLARRLWKQFSSTLLPVVHAWMWQHQFVIVSVLVSFLIGTIFLKYFWSDARRNPSYFLLLICLLFISIFAVSFFIDVYEGLNVSKHSAMKHRQQQLHVQKRVVLDKYKYECNWNELSVIRQLSLHVKAMFWSLFGQDGYRYLSVNANSFLINDPMCQNYLEQLDNEHLVQTEHAQRVGTLYGNLAKGFVGSLAEIVADFGEILVHRTSLITKLWMIVCLALFLVLLAKRLLMGCCCW